MSFLKNYLLLLSSADNPKRFDDRENGRRRDIVVVVAGDDIGLFGGTSKLESRFHIKIMSLHLFVFVLIELCRAAVAASAVTLAEKTDEKIEIETRQRQ